MAAYVEGSVRLRWIDRTRRAAGCGGTGPLGDPNYLVSGPIGPGNSRGQGIALKGLRSNPALASLNERIGLISPFEIQFDWPQLIAGCSCETDPLSLPLHGKR
jgi:hypothetical protein